MNRWMLTFITLVSSFNAIADTDLSELGNVLSVAPQGG